MDKLRKLQEDRQPIAAEIKTLRADIEENGYSDEKQTRWNELCEQIDKVDSEIKWAKDAAKRAADEKAIWNDRASDDTRNTKEPLGGEINAQTRTDAMRGWLAAPTGNVTDQQRQAMAELGVDPGQNHFRFNLSEKQCRTQEEIRDYYSGSQKRAQTVTTTGGGYLVNNELIQAYDEAMLYYAPVRQFATVIRTETGAQLPIPTSNDTSNKGELLAINTQVSEQDVTFGQEVLDAYKFSSDLVRMPYEFLNDAFLNVDQWIGRTLGERQGRIHCQYFTTGTGSSQPEGLTAGSADSGVTLASATAITYDELTDIYHAVDPAYRNMPNCAWTFHDTWLKYMRQIKDANGLPIWNPGLGAAPDTVLGKPYMVNNEMPTGSSAKVIVFGDMAKLYIRDVALNGIELVRMNERYADYAQVGFVSFTRMDSVVVDAGTNPLVYATSG